MRRHVAAGLFVVALLPAACSSDKEKPASSGDPSASEETTTTGATGSTTTTLAVGTTSTTVAAGIALTGAAVVPGPGDPDGSGTATVRVDTDHNEVCVTLTVAKIDPAVRVVLRRAKAGEAGEQVAAMKPPTSTPVCAATDAIVVADLQAAPGDFALVVVNETHPNGALRGQLK
jgi:hypothetical protein